MASISQSHLRLKSRSIMSSSNLVSRRISCGSNTFAHTRPGPQSSVLSQHSRRFSILHPPTSSPSNLLGPSKQIRSFSSSQSTNANEFDGEEDEDQDNDNEDDDDDDEQSIEKIREAARLKRERDGNDGWKIAARETLKLQGEWRSGLQNKDKVNVNNLSQTSETASKDVTVKSNYSETLVFPPPDATILDLDSGEGLGRKIAIYNARHDDGLARTPVACLYSGKTGKRMFTLRKEELEAVVELIPKLKPTFRKFSKI